MVIIRRGEGLRFAETEAYPAPHPRRFSQREKRAKPSPRGRGSEMVRAPG